MTEGQAFDLADKLLVLINSQPRTPSRFEIAQLIMRERPLEPIRVPAPPDVAEEYRKLMRLGREVKEERDRIYWTYINDPRNWNQL